MVHEITIEGYIRVCEYCSYERIEDALNDKYYPYPSDYIFDEEHRTINSWGGFKGIYLDYDRNKNYLDEIKFHTVNDYFHNLFSPDSYHPLPVELHIGVIGEVKSLSYIIHTKRDIEAFDINKLSLIYSRNEIEPLKDFVLAEKIMYDGMEFPVRFKKKIYDDFGLDDPFVGTIDIYDEYDFM